MVSRRRKQAEFDWDKYFDERPVEEGSSCTEHTLRTWLEECGFKFDGFEKKSMKDDSGRWYHAQWSYWITSDGRRIRDQQAIREAEGAMRGAVDKAVEKDEYAPYVGALEEFEDEREYEYL